MPSCTQPYTHSQASTETHTHLPQVTWKLRQLCTHMPSACYSEKCSHLWGKKTPMRRYTPHVRAFHSRAQVEEGKPRAQLRWCLWVSGILAQSMGWWWGEAANQFLSSKVLVASQSYSGCANSCTLEDDRQNGTDCHHWLPPEGQGDHLIPLQHTPARLVSKKESLAPSNEQQCGKHTRATFLSPCAIKNLSSFVDFKREGQREKGR